MSMTARSDSPLPTDLPRGASVSSAGLPYYVGTTSLRWNFLQQADPATTAMEAPAARPRSHATQNGSRVANRELFPRSDQHGAPRSAVDAGPCIPEQRYEHELRGSAILELQFYPGSGCPGDDSKWCASLTIDELTTNCGEPITAAPVRMAPRVGRVC